MNKYKELLKRRLTMLPWMRKYDLLRQHVMPYTCQSNPPNYYDEVIETDSLGYRISYFKNDKITSANWYDYGKKAIITGGSVAFGYGASGDGQTLSSYLSLSTDMAALNLGIIAGNSMQEVISALPFVNEASLVISITGVNTLYACISDEEPFFEIYSPLFPFNNKYFKEMYKKDILFNSYFIMNDLNPKDYFKDEKQKKNFHTNLMRRYRERIKNRLICNDGNLYNVQKLEKALNRAIKYQTKDILNMFHLTESKKYLCLIQPLLPTMHKVLSDEEKELMKISNTLKITDHLNSQQLMIKIWIKYIEALKTFCTTNGIPNIVLNEKKFQGWSFVDSGHLSDNGNKQVADWIVEFLSSK